MLELFRKNTFFSIILLIPYVIILHAAPFFIKIDKGVSDHCWIFKQLIVDSGISYPLEILISILIILFQAVLIGRIVSQYKLNPNGQLFASLFFVIFCGLHYSTLTLNPGMIANLFFTIGIYQLFGVYLKKSASIQLFNYGFFIGLASLFYPAYIVFVFLGIIGVVVLRGTRFVELLQMLGGFVNVYLLLFAILYIFNVTDAFWKQQISGYFSPYMFSLKFGNKGWVAFSLILLFIIISFMQYQFFQSKRTIMIQKQYDLIFWSLFVSVFTLFFARIDSMSHMFVLFTPLSILFGLLLTRIKSPLLQETLHLFLVITALFLQFQNW